jgi:hypothetical protein
MTQLVPFPSHITSVILFKGGKGKELSETNEMESKNRLLNQSDWTCMEQVVEGFGTTKGSPSPCLVRIFVPQYEGTSLHYSTKQKSDVNLRCGRFPICDFRPGACPRMRLIKPNGCVASLGSGSPVPVRNEARCWGFEGLLRCGVSRSDMVFFFSFDG